MSEYARSELTTLRRYPARGRFDRATVHAILDEALYCHVSCNTPDRTFCTPMVYARRGEEILLHGSAGNRTLRTLRDGALACVNVTLLDGLVLGRSAFHTSVNYRSVTIFGRAEEVREREEKVEAMRAIVEGVLPDRWKDLRPPTEQEIAMTLVLRLPLVEVSAKVRDAPPADDEADLALPTWAGVIPVSRAFGTPEPAPDAHPDVPVPANVSGYRRPGAVAER